MPEVAPWNLYPFRFGMLVIYRKNEFTETFQYTKWMLVAFTGCNWTRGIDSFGSFLVRLLEELFYNTTVILGIK